MASADAGKPSHWCYAGNRRCDHASRHCRSSAYDQRTDTHSGWRSGCSHAAGRSTAHSGAHSSITASNHSWRRPYLDGGGASGCECGYSGISVDVDISPRNEYLSPVLATTSPAPARKRLFGSGFAAPEPSPRKSWLLTRPPNSLAPGRELIQREDRPARVGERQRAQVRATDT